MNLFSKQLDLHPQALNLAESQKDYAVFLPSISAIYAKIVSMPEYTVRDRLPDGLNNDRIDLDFLNQKNSLMYYPAALYSAGHAYLDPADSDIYESMVQKRDRSNTVILGDSGGFQIATGVLKWPWTKKGKQTDQDWEQDKDKMRMKILRWLEHTADYSMVLDVPTYGLVKFGFDPVTGESLHPGMKTFRDCLNVSLENYDFFIKHRKEGATKFLNVLQGRNEAEGDIWWDAVKDLPFETWAFSNVQASNFAINLRRLIIMRDGKYLDGRDWLHYLGNGKIKAGCALTTLQRNIRQFINPNITLSFDAASPFVMTAKGQMYYGYENSHRNMRFKGGSIVDDKSLKNSQMLINDWVIANDRKGVIMPTEIGRRCTVGDICVRGYDDLDYKKIPFSKKEIESDWYPSTPEGRCGDKFRWTDAYKEYLAHDRGNGGLFDFGGSFDKEYEKYQVKWPSSMDGFSYLIAMHHNVELHIRAIQDACRWQDQPLLEANNHVTPDLLEFKDLCPEILTSERPMDLINKHEKLLRNITGMDADNNVSMEMEDFDEA
jgi:hypothetical protein